MAWPDRLVQKPFDLPRGARMQHTAVALLVIWVAVPGTVAVTVIVLPTSQASLIGSGTGRVMENRVDSGGASMKVLLVRSVVNVRGTAPVFVTVTENAAVSPGSTRDSEHVWVTVKSPGKTAPACDVFAGTALGKPETALATVPDRSRTVPGLWIVIRQITSSPTRDAWSGGVTVTSIYGPSAVMGDFSG